MEGVASQLLVRLRTPSQSRQRPAGDGGDGFFLLRPSDAAKTGSPATPCWGGRGWLEPFADERFDQFSACNAPLVLGGGGFEMASDAISLSPFTATSCGPPSRLLRVPTPPRPRRR